MSVPQLQPDGTVAFASREAHRSAYGPYLSKGGLMVEVSPAPAPLAMLEVRLSGGYLAAPLSLRCQVVAVLPGRAILHIQGFGPELAKALEPGEPEAPAFQLIGAPAAIHTPAPLRLTPTQEPPAPAPAAPAFALLEVPPAGRRSTAPPAASEPAPSPFDPGPPLDLSALLAIPEARVPPPPVEPRRPDAIAPQAPTPPPAPTATAPPILEGGNLLRFLSPAEFHAARAGWEAEGTLVAAFGCPPPLDQPLALTLQVGGYLHPQPVPAVAEPATKRCVTLVFPDRVALAERLAHLAARLEAEAARPASRAPGRRSTQPLSEAPPAPAGRLEGDRLLYPGPAEFLGAPRGAHGALSLGALASPAPNLGQTMELELWLGPAPAGRLRFQVAYVAPGYAHLLADDPAAAERVAAAARALQELPPAPPRRPATRELESRPPPRPPADPFAPVGQAAARPPSAPTPAIPFPALSTAAVLGVATPQRWGLPLQGAFRNPETPEAFLSQTLVLPPSPAELAAPGAPLLLRWLCGVPGSQLLAVSVGGKTTELAVSGGLELRLNLPTESVARVLAEPAGTYALTPLPGPPRSARNIARTRALLAEVLRALLKRFSEPALAAAFSFKASHSPRLNERGVALVPSLGLVPGVQRTARRMLDGQYRVEEVVHSGAGTRGGWELLYLLDLLAGLDWVEPPARAVDAVDVVEERARALEGKDLFEVLGRHWSSAPRSLEPAYRALSAQYAPGSPADQGSPAAAARIRARVEEAWRVLQRRDTRVAYRQKALAGVQFGYQVEVMVTQARLAGMRGELAHARELLEGAMDVAPSAEVSAELSHLRELEERAKEG